MCYWNKCCHFIQSNKKITSINNLKIKSNISLFPFVLDFHAVTIVEIIIIEIFL